MKTIRALGTVPAAIVLLASQAMGQATNRPLTTLEDDTTNEWSFSAMASASFVPHSRDDVAPAFTADRDWLHLEARYNYEDLDTGSLWAGYNFSIGNKLVLEATPILGGVFGNTTGIAPGYRLSLSYRRLDLYSLGAYVFDTGNNSQNFYYTWSELAYSPADWFWVGLVALHAEAFESKLNIQRGLLVGFAYKKVDFTTYLFNLGWEDPTVVTSVGVRF
jgi:hypothetical protein